MKQQTHADNQRSTTTDKKPVAHQRENNTDKRTEKKVERSTGKHRSNRVEQDGSDHVL